MTIGLAAKAIVAASFVFLLAVAEAILPSDALTLSAQERIAGETVTEAQAKSAGCITCHTSTDEPTMHPTGTVSLGCTDCHGGDADVRAPLGAATTDTAYQRAKRS